MDLTGPLKHERVRESKIHFAEYPLHSQSEGNARPHNQMRYTQITVRAAYSQEDLEANGSNVEYDFDTIAEAKRKAKHYLTDDYMHTVEASQPNGYAQIIADGEVLYDFFR